MRAFADADAAATARLATDRYRDWLARTLTATLLGSTTSTDRR